VKGPREGRDTRRLHAKRAWALVAAATACTPRHGVDATDASVAIAARDAAWVATAMTSARPRSAPRASPPSTGMTRDGGAPTCKIVGGPTAQPFVGPSALRMAPRTEGEVPELVYNDGGSPRVYDARITISRRQGPAPAKSTLPACAVTDDVFYCPDATGAIHRSRGVGESGVIIARGRPGTGVVAASLSGRPLVAYLAERLTTEGLVREAWAAMDGATPVRLSEDGSGATFVDLAPRGETLIAMMIDARVAMTPAHARILTRDENTLQIGNDAVIFVGGPAERYNSGALATTEKGGAFALLAVAEDTLHFGMAAIRVDDPPVDDASVVWSYYPNGLDPAPIAATRGERELHIARVRPKSAEPDAPHVLEVGTLEPSGAYRSACIIAESAFVKDVELARDRQKTLWIFYRTPSGSFLARVSAT
jgi:hypothetical protein